MEEKALIRKLRKLRPEPSRRDGPLVSIVVTNRNGEEHLRRLVSGLDRCTLYRSFEIVLVDNGSTDGSLNVLERSGIAKRVVVANAENKGFSTSNNQGIRAATGDLVLLANNDIEPIHPEWLGYMVESLRPDVAAVGALLVYPRRPRREKPPAHPDLTIQHLGMQFVYSQWGVRGFNVAAGTDPLSITTPACREVPAVTAACLLARRSDLLAHPFDEEYWYGSEDWDLCLRLGNTGQIVIDERAVLFHHEYGTQAQHMSEEWLAARTRNHLRFNALWGPALMRKLRSETTRAPSSRFFRGHRVPTVAVTSGAEAHSNELAGELRRQALDAGWNVIAIETRACDAAIAVSPPRDAEWLAGIDLSVAVVIDRADEWAVEGRLDGATRVVVPDRITQARVAAQWGDGVAEVDPGLVPVSGNVFERLLALASPRETAMRIGVSTCAPDRVKAPFWGDTHLARGLMRAFRRLGHEASELPVPDWSLAKSASCDVIVHLRGLTRRPVARGQWNILWIISHPGRLQPGECNDYDVIASASESHAAELSEQLGRVVHFLPQATDSDAFKPSPTDPDYEAVLYVGNARWPHRRAPRWLMRNHRRFDLYGKNWTDFPESGFVRREYIPNHALGVAYRSAKVVVADHHGSMREQGFVGNRIFDVLASGGVVLSDDVQGLEQLLGDCVPSYSSAHDLDRQLDVLLSDDALRRRLAQDGRRRVMAEHTLDHRAQALLAMLDAL